jgi:Flp pilus assembly protein TadD
LSEGDWQNAESYLQTARQLAPEDNVVQANLKRWAEMKEEGKGKN